MRGEDKDSDIGLAVGRRRWLQVFEHDKNTHTAAVTVWDYHTVTAITKCEGVYVVGRGARRKAGAKRV